MFTAQKNENKVLYAAGYFEEDLKFSHNAIQKMLS